MLLKRKHHSATKLERSLD